MMIFHSVLNHVVKLSVKILECLKNKRKLKIISIKKYLNLSGNLHGYLSRKIKSQMEQNKNKFLKKLLNNQLQEKSLKCPL